MLDFSFRRPHIVRMIDLSSLLPSKAKSTLTDILVKEFEKIRFKDDAFFEYSDALALIGSDRYAFRILPECFERAKEIYCGSKIAA